MPRGTQPDPPPKYRLLQTSSGHFCTHPRRTVKPCARWRAGACQPMGADTHARVLGLRHIGRCPLTWHRATTDVRLPDQARERPHRGCGQPADALVAGPPVVQRPLAGSQAAWHFSAHWPMFGMLRPSGVHLVGHRRGADMTASDWHPLAAAFLLATVQTRLQTLVRTRFCTHDEYESSFDMRSGRWPREERSALGYRRWGTQNGESGSRSGGARSGTSWLRQACWIPGLLASQSWTRSCSGHSKTEGSLRAGRSGTAVHLPQHRYAGAGGLKAPG